MVLELKLFCSYCGYFLYVILFWVGFLVGVLLIVFKEVVFNRRMFYFVVNYNYKESVEDCEVLGLNGS